MMKIKSKIKSKILELRSCLFCLSLIFILMSSVSATLEISGANDYESGFDPDNVYKLSETDIVSPSSGTFIIKDTDVYLPGKNGLDLKLERTYNSGVWINRINGDPSNDNIGQLKEFSYLGIGWQPFSFGMLRLTWSQGPSSSFFYPGGSYLEFGDGNQYKIFLDQTGTGYLIENHPDWKLEVIPGGSWPDYRLIKEDGTIYFFEGNGCMANTITLSFMGSPTNVGTSKYCYVTSITDTNENSISIHYKDIPAHYGSTCETGWSGTNENVILPQNSGAIDYIVDSLGREVHFYYNIIQDDPYLVYGYGTCYIEHYILDKLTYSNTNNELITVDYTVTQSDEGTSFPLGNTLAWDEHEYKLDKVEIKKGNTLLKPKTYYYYNNYGELETVIYNKKSELPDSHLTQDSKVVYGYDKVKNQYSDVSAINQAGYSSRLKDKKVYDGMNNMYEWQYKYGNGQTYYDSSNGALTQRTFLHCDDTASPTATNCASSSTRVGPTETGGTVINSYKQVKVINPNGDYVVNNYYGTNQDLTNIYQGWCAIRDTSGLLKNSTFFESNGNTLKIDQYGNDFYEVDIDVNGWIIVPYGDKYCKALLKEKKIIEYDSLGNSKLKHSESYSYGHYVSGVVPWMPVWVPDPYDNIKSYSGGGYIVDRAESSGIAYTLNYTYESNEDYKEKNVLNKVELKKSIAGYSAPCLGGGSYNVSKINNEYDSEIKGNIISEEQTGIQYINFIEKDITITKNYEYDDYGNVINEIYPNGNNFETRYDNGFDAYPSSGWNDEYGSESNPAWEKEYYDNGLLKQENNKNNGITKYYYDDLNRIKKIVYPGDTETQSSLEYTYYDFKNSVKVKSKKTNNVYNNDIYYFYDGLGRLIQNKQNNVDGDVLVSSIKYDGINNKIYTSENYVVSGSSSTYSVPNWFNLISQNKVNSYEYDFLSRVTKKTDFDNTFIQIKYGPLWKIVIDENGIKTKYDYDAYDRLVMVEENYVECNNNDVRPCPKQIGVCEDSEQTCSNGVWQDCDYGNNYWYYEVMYGENTFKCVDDLDNDCDGFTDNEDKDCSECEYTLHMPGSYGTYKQTSNYCVKQAGVCENSQGSMKYEFGDSLVYLCTVYDYGQDYQRIEVNCNDDLDNDCDGLTDESDDCNKIITQYHYDSLNNLIRVVDPRGKIIEKYYDGLNRLKYSISYDKGLTEYMYDNNANIVEKITNNLLKNNNFENLDEFWIFDSGVSLNSNSYFGEYSVKASGNYKYANQEAYILGSQEYILSLYAEAESKNLGVIIYLYDKYGNEIDPDSVSIGTGWSPGCGADHHCWYSGSIPVEEQYSRIILPYFNTPSGANKIKIGIGASVTGSGYIYIDAIQLEKGTEAKPYSLTGYEYNALNEVIETSYPGLVENWVGI
ncbi:MAG: hypothetical protein V1663_02875 [archaeon]